MVQIEAIEKDDLLRTGQSTSALIHQPSIGEQLVLVCRLDLHQKSPDFGERQCEPKGDLVQQVLINRIADRAMHVVFSCENTILWKPHNLAFLGAISDHIPTCSSSHHHHQTPNPSTEGGIV